MNEFKKIKSFANSLTRKNIDNRSSADVYSVTKYDGFVRSLDYFKKQVFSRDLSTYKIVKKGEFAYSTIHLDEGAIGLLREDEALISPMYTVFEVDKSVDIFYLNHLLSCDLLLNKYALIGQGSVNRRKSVPFSTFSDLEVRIPSLKEQKKIAEILSEIDKLIESKKVQIEKLMILKRALLNSFISSIDLKYKKFPLSDFVVNYVGGASLKPSDFNNSGFQIIPKKAVQLGGKINLGDELLYCSYKFAEENSNHIIDYRYVISTLRDLVPSGPSIGLVGVLEEKGKFILAQGVYGFLLNEDLDNQFFVQISNTDWYRRLMRKIMVGSTQVHIRSSEFLKINLPIPPIKEQKKLVKILASLDKRISMGKENLIQLKNLKRGLLNDLLSGLQKVKV
ncbi:restriction endonuclease subunit S [Prochlorococcus marinus]|uniref:restriction endonuclease subunit S n=1 Tax=Prochlorococcus marinus TaxID=1219 RepID=UPI000533760D|nr:restriction endonuclease subunit S [Prochlorococcus marinus]KGF90870.1 Type I restriction-modification system [Prochlorococcus marinus str. MIT 9107]